jgi:plastocyanin
MSRMNLRREGRVLRVLVAIALIAGLVLATVGTAVGAVKVVKAADGNKFKPVHKYITKGDKIRWKNVDNINHTVKATNKKKNWNYFRNLSPGETATRKFGNVGNYHYKCTLHPGMAAYIHVRKG